MVLSFRVTSSFFFKIFDEKPVFEGSPKVDAKNEKYVKPGGNVKVVCHYIITTKHLYLTKTYF